MACGGATSTCSITNGFPTSHEIVVANIIHTLHQILKLKDNIKTQYKKQDNWAKSPTTKKNQKQMKFMNIAQTYVKKCGKNKQPIHFFFLQKNHKKLFGMSSHEVSNTQMEHENNNNSRDMTQIIKK